jgi:8-oxo-dGTP pyrophosphatase MutT (NUDIX family)
MRGAISHRRDGIISAMPSLDEIRRGLDAREPVRVSEDGVWRAAVAMVLRRARAGTEVLLIERALREGDPWSGHMAFPGGRVDPEDADPRSAAERETLEEVGVDLSIADRLGRLDDLRGHRASGAASLVVSAFVYHVPEPPSLLPNHEVREAFWFPVAALLEPERRVEYPVRHLHGAPYPGILVGEPVRHVVWGLTYRFLEIFFEAIGRNLPNRWEARPHAAETGA